MKVMKNYWKMSFAFEERIQRRVTQSVVFITFCKTLNLMSITMNGRE